MFPPPPEPNDEHTRQRIATRQLDARRLVRGGTLNLIGGLSNAALTFGFTLLITHQLGAAGAGTFFQAVGIFTILTIVSQLGASTTIVKTISAYRAGGRHRDIIASVRSAVLPAAAVSIVAAGLIFVTAPWLADVLTKQGDRQDALTYLRVFSLFIPFAVVSAILLAATRGLGRMLPTVALDSIAKPAARFAFAGLGTLVALTATTTAVLWAAPLALVAFLSALALRRLAQRSAAENDALAEDMNPSREVFAEFWRFTIPQWVAEISQLAVLWIDVVLLGALASSREAGIYAAVSRLVQVGTIGLAAVSLVLAPMLSASLARTQLDHARWLYRIATLALAATSIPIFLVLANFAPLLAQIFGHDFGEGSTALTILAFAMLIDVVAGPALLMLLMGGRSRLIMLDSCVALAANIALNVILIPDFGMTGAAIAWSASILLSNLLAVIQIRYLWGVQPFTRGLAVVALATGACFGIAGIAAVAIGGQNISTLLVSTAVGGLVYATILWRARGVLGLASLVAAIRLPAEITGR
jgi:O-antigen/teichoic acid export membrane protein